MKRILAVAVAVLALLTAAPAPAHPGDPLATAAQVQQLPAGTGACPGFGPAAPAAACVFPAAFTLGGDSGAPDNSAVGPKVVAWMGDGDLVPFNGNGFRGGIYIASIDGTNPRKIISFENGNRDIHPHGFNTPEDHPSFSPDGRLLVFTSNRASRTNWDIYRATVDGRNIVRLTTDPGMDTEPVFSPDGTRIMWASQAAGSLDIWTMNADGTGKARLLGDPVKAEFEPAWSPDGRTVAFTRDNGPGAGEFDVYLDTLASPGNPRRMTAFPGEDHDASWNPQSTKLVLTSEIDPFSPPYGNTWIMDVNTARMETDLTSQFFRLAAGDPHWSFDGTKIAFFKSSTRFLQSPQQLWRMNADGSQKAMFATDGIINVHPAIGRAADDDADGTPNYRESPSVGVASVKVPRTLRADTVTSVPFGWTHPRRWRRLDTVRLLVTSGGRPVSAIRYGVGTRRFSVWNSAAGTWSAGARTGVLRSGAFSLDLRRTRFVNVSRRTMRLELALRPDARAAGRAFGLQVAADDADGGDQGEPVSARFRVVR